MSQAPALAWIVGCGDVGCRLATRLVEAGLNVTGWVRTPASAVAVERTGAAARIADLDSALASITDPPRWLFWFAPPPGEGARDPRLRNFLAAMQAPPQRLIYLSTSAVYGDCGGRWIDEDAPLQPANPRGQRRLDAEQAAFEYAARSLCEVLILRVPGIYGPGRLPLERLRAGTPILRADDAPYSNRIHADDLAEAAWVVARAGAAGAAYNVSDGDPTSMTDYFLRCAQLLGLPLPPQVDFAAAREKLGPSMMSFLEESKRLRNDRLRALGWTPQYPNLERGLPACL